MTIQSAPTNSVPDSSQPHRDESDPQSHLMDDTGTLDPNQLVPHSSQPHRDEWKPASAQDQSTPTPLETFLAQAQALSHILNSTTAHPQAAGDPIPKAMLSDLLGRLSAQSEPSQPALFAWLLLRATYSAARARELFDELQLRNGLAQTFAAFALHGEQGWRAAAQVRLLLATDIADLNQTIAGPTFWQNPDTHWLADLDATNEYLNQESFEQLLPLLAFPTSASPKVQSRILFEAKQAGYKIQALVRSANPLVAV